MNIKAGDIIGFSGDCLVSDLINIATYGVPRRGTSHVGVMARAADGRLLVFESTSMESLPCEISHENFAGTQAHRLDDVLRVYDGRVWHYPLCRPLYPHEDERLTGFLMETIHVPYDAMGAFRSAGVGLSWVESLLREQDLGAIFCSEWTAAAHTYVGVFRTGNVSRWNPNRFIRAERRQHILLRPLRLK